MSATTNHAMRLLLGATLSLGACDDGESEPAVLEAELGPAGGEVSGEAGGVFDGFRLAIPAGALSEAVTLRITPATDTSPLPPNGAAVGPAFDLQPHVDLAGVATLTLPFEPRRSPVTASISPA